MKLKMAAMTAFLVSWGTLMVAHAGDNEVTLRVDGLACPFCAYGLEKKLKKLEGVGSFDILINEGMVNIQWDGEKPFLFGVVDKAVEKAGYTLRSAKTGFVGSVEKIGDRFVLVPDTGHEERYSLYDPARIDPKSKGAHKHEGAPGALGEERVRQLEGIIGRKDIVRIFGAVHGHKGKGVLPALGIERLEVLSPEVKE